MTVRELIEKLLTMPLEAEVFCEDEDFSQTAIEHAIEYAEGSHRTRVIIG